MNILFIYWANPGDPGSSTLSRDMADEFSRQGHEVTSVIPLEKKFKKATYICQKPNHTTLHLRTGNFFNLTSKVEKAITALTIANTLLNGIMEYLKNYKFDLIITRAPFLGDPKLVIPLRQYYKCPVYLMLFDIFPQTAWDMGIIKSRLIYNFFKHQEKKMLEALDIIWCTSPGNARYMLNAYPNLNPKHIKWLYHYATIEPSPQIDKLSARQSLGYNENDFIALFGGNMGIPQKLENLLFLANKAKSLPHAKFLFIGVGTEKDRIEKMAKTMQLDNVKFISYLPRPEYELLAAICNIGLVSLDERFTVPNFPSKTTDYFKICLPILASLDASAADDYGNLLQNEIHAGLYALSGDISTLFEKFKQLYNDPTLCIEMGKNGREFYEQELNVTNACKKIINEFKPE